jgi:DNA polymerase-3 subunit delta'
LDNIKGQDAAVRALVTALSSGRVPHSFLFAGPSGVGRALAAYEVAKALLCPKGPAAACGKCPSCRRVDSRTHGDLFVVGLSNGSAQIKIDPIRDLCGVVAQTPLEGTRKVAVIDPADAMTEEAQNAFLKTLEEPPADTTIILIAENTDALLPTVRSRCRRVNFARLGEDVIRERLIESGIGKAKAAALARLSDGSLGTALAFSEGRLLEVKREFIAAVLAAKPGDEETIAERIAPSDKKKKKKPQAEIRQEAVVLLTMLESAMADCLRAKAGAPVRTNSDLAAELESFAGTLDIDALEALEKAVSDAIILLGYYADAKLVAMHVAAAFSRRGSRTQVEV